MSTKSEQEGYVGAEGPGEAPYQKEFEERQKEAVEAGRNASKELASLLNKGKKKP